MVRVLKVTFVLIFLAIGGATGWATLQMPFWETPRNVVGHPWFVATLVDTYLAFFTFWLWVAYKETSSLSRIVWLLLIFGLGNMAMAAYALIQLVRLPPGATIEHFLVRRNA